MEPIRILHIVTSMNVGGIENFIMNNYRNIDRSRVQFDFLKHRDTHDFYDDEILALGGRIYSIPPINPLRQKHYDKEIAAFFEKHKSTYRVVHSHINTFSAYPLRIATKIGIPVRIAHSHAVTTCIDLKTPFRIYTKRIINKYITDAFACSKDAGHWLFGNNEFEVFPNSIDTKKFSFCAEDRELVRNDLKISNAYVIGMVANFSSIKNHKFIVNVFYKLLRKIPNSYLVLIGDGETRSDIERQLKRLNIMDNVIFLGLQKNVAKYLQSFDVFVLPSISEGFSISVLEAESVGIPCLLSNGVPKDVKLFNSMNTEFLPINDEDLWVEKIIALKDVQKKSSAHEISLTNYDAENSANTLMDFYEAKHNLGGN